MAQNTGGITDQDKLVAALGYPIGVIVPLIVLLTEFKNRPFLKYHAIQSLGLTVALFVVDIVACVFFAVVAAIIPPIACLAMPVYWVIWLAPTLYYAYKAYQGEYVVIPVITDFLKQQKWL